MLKVKEFITYFITIFAESFVIDQICLIFCLILNRSILSLNKWVENWKRLNQTWTYFTYTFLFHIESYIPSILKYIRQTQKRKVVREAAKKFFFLVARPLRRGGGTKKNWLFYPYFSPKKVPMATKLEINGLWCFYFFNSLGGLYVNYLLQR